MNCYPTLAEIAAQKEELRKSKEFTIERCISCKNFQPDWEGLVGYCEVKKLWVCGVAICSVGKWVKKD